VARQAAEEKRGEICGEEFPELMGGEDVDPELEREMNSALLDEKISLYAKVLKGTYCMGSPWCLKQRLMSSKTIMILSNNYTFMVQTLGVHLNHV
jgi:hypothetical protein